MDTGTYRAFGLTISSDIPLPELQPIQAGAADCAFRMAVGAAPIDRSEPEWVHRSLRADASVWLAIGHRGAAHIIGFPGIAEFSISPDGAEIQARRGRGVPLATIRHLLLDHVLPRVLDLKGALVLHAGTVGNGA